jgi:hypothetical protein
MYVAGAGELERFFWFSSSRQWWASRVVFGVMLERVPGSGRFLGHLLCIFRMRD